MSLSLTVNEHERALPKRRDFLIVHGLHGGIGTALPVEAAVVGDKGGAEALSHHWKVLQLERVPRRRILIRSHGVWRRAWWQQVV